MSIDATGITVKRLADIRESLNERARAAFGSTVNVATDSVLGRLIGIFAAELSLVHELAQETYDAIDPDQAVGSQLDNLCALIGVSREPARSTYGSITLTGDGGTLINAGSIFQTVGTEYQYATQSEVILGLKTLATGSITITGATRQIVRAAGTWLADGVAVGTEITLANTSANNLTGTVASVAGSVITLTSASTMVDETAPAPIVTIFAASVDVAAINTGALVTTAAELTGIVTAITGLDTVINPDDLTTGRATELDSELRIRREQSLQITGASVDYAIRAKLLALSTVDQCLVISNRSDSYVGLRPPHSFEAVVWPDVGDDIAIASKIFEVQPAGILAYGTTVATVSDAQGFDQTVGFSYATERAMYVRATLTRGPDYPANGDELLASALLTIGNTLSVGDDVLIWKFNASPLESINTVANIPGIKSIVVEVEEANPPTNTANIAIADTEVATFSTSRINVVAV